MQFKDRTTHSPEIMEPLELQPFSRPETALSEALQYLSEDDWWVLQVSRPFVHV